MFCPKCGVEYRAGFKRCSDCGVDLVATRPADLRGSEDPRSHEAPIAVWRGDDPVAFSAALAALEAAGIPSRELTMHDQFAQILAIQPSELAIIVDPKDAARAQEIIREALEPEPPGPEAS
jgi:hypothetical protein